MIHCQLADPVGQPRLVVGWAGQRRASNREDRRWRPRVTHVADLDAVLILPVIVVPAANVVSVVDEGRVGVAVVVVISAGFAETAGDGVDRDCDLPTADRYGMRVLGPNCLGWCQRAPAQRHIHAPGDGARVDCYRLAVRGVGIVFAAEAARRRWGSRRSCRANKIDVSRNDVLRYTSPISCPGTGRSTIDPALIDPAVVRPKP